MTQKQETPGSVIWPGFRLFFIVYLLSGGLLAGLLVLFSAPVPGGWVSGQDLSVTVRFGFGAGIFIMIGIASWFVAYGITWRRMHQAQLMAISMFDSLTGLPNRRLFFDHLDTAIKHDRRNKTMTGLLYLNLDGFKKVNAELGHDAGDELLCVVARILEIGVRQSDTVARLGGDEYAMILPLITAADGAERVAEKVMAALTKPVQLIVGSVAVSVSIGAAVTPRDSDDVDELMRRLDLAVSMAKKRSGNACVVVGPEG
mgnify:FL=1